MKTIQIVSTYPYNSGGFPGLAPLAMRVLGGRPPMKTSPGASPYIIEGLIRMIPDLDGVLVITDIPGGKALPSESSWSKVAQEVTEKFDPGTDSIWKDKRFGFILVGEVHRGEKVLADLQNLMSVTYKAEVNPEWDAVLADSKITDTTNRRISDLCKALMG